ncbi:MAG: hypothetical protein O3A51_11380 [Verrucomicrobia bacterium]|nr:hypothetical protein [Verrucomicrobiota bacterium]
MTTTEKTSSDDLLTFLKQEIEIQEKRNRQMMTWGLVMLALIGGYMTFIGHFIRTSVLHPKHAAEWVAYMTEENVPVLLAETERTLVEQAPAVADQVMRGALAVPGYIGDEARRQIDLVVTEMLPLLEVEMALALREYFEAHADDAAEFYAHSQDPEFVQAFVDQIATDVVVSLDAEMRKDGGLGVQHMVTMSRDALQAIDQQLGHLANTDDVALNREDQLHKRLVILCLRVLDDLMAEAGEPLLDLTATL